VYMTTNGASSPGGRLVVMGVCLPDDSFGSPAKEVVVRAIKSNDNKKAILNMVDPFPEIRCCYDSGFAVYFKDITLIEAVNVYSDFASSCGH